ncbi:MAG: GtrA family protein [Rudaea sp.]|uniref:GtrA family protein n=1 Tax=unclassified Rudaea TaxID=2627037 RepID=UPI0010F51027|nr:MULTISPECIES: GtrA family protein [unclassified Rudaea]MBN8887164.1 GtrA family protein [Rudaea sp.]
MDRIEVNEVEIPRARTPREFLRFLFTGGAAAAINFCSRIVLNQWLTFALSVVLAYLIGFAVAFVLFRRYVFPKSNQPVRKQILWFLTVNLAALAQTVLISLLLANYVLPAMSISWHSHEIAHAVGIAVPVFTSFLGHKYLSFSSATAADGKR